MRSLRTTSGRTPVPGGGDGPSYERREPRRGAWLVLTGAVVGHRRRRSSPPSPLIDARRRGPGPACRGRCGSRRRRPPPPPTAVRRAPLARRDRGARPAPVGYDGPVAPLVRAACAARSHGLPEVGSRASRLGDVVARGRRQAARDRSPSIGPTSGRGARLGAGRRRRSRRAGTLEHEPHGDRGYGAGSATSRSTRRWTAATTEGRRGAARSRPRPGPGDGRRRPRRGRLPRPSPVRVAERAVDRRRRDSGPSDRSGIEGAPRRTHAVSRRPRRSRTARSIARRGRRRRGCAMPGERRGAGGNRGRPSEPRRDRRPPTPAATLGTPTARRSS